MVLPRDGTSSAVESLLKTIGKGRRLSEDVSEALERMFGVTVGIDGLSRLFQPGFPGVRAFAVETRLAPDQAVEITLVGIARDGAPVWIGERAFVKGRDGSLEIHHGLNEIEPEYRSRNITVDVIQRELDILALLGTGPFSRITIDAEGVGSYICALHGFVFADESEEGPPIRSARALEPIGDRRRVIDAALPCVERIGLRVGAQPAAIDEAKAQVRAAQAPWDLLRVTIPGVQPELAEGHDGEMGVSALGRELLLSPEIPGWRATLGLDASSEGRTLGDEYRRRKTHRSEARLAVAIQENRDQLRSPKRETRARALRNLGMIAPPWVAPDVKALEGGPERRIAVIARQTMRQISGADLADRLIAFAENPKNDPARRGRAYRVLAEHYRSRISSMVSMLRVNPDARIQRAIVPIVAGDLDAGPGLASMLAANPAQERRPGLTSLRLELIERLTGLLDPQTLPVLMAAYQAKPPPPPAEMLALSRALVSFPDPRAQIALAEVARRLERPQIP